MRQESNLRSAEDFIRRYEGDAYGKAVALTSAATQAGDLVAARAYAAAARELLQRGYHKRAGARAV